MPSTTSIICCLYSIAFNFSRCICKPGEYDQMSILCNRMGVLYSVDTIFWSKVHLPYHSLCFYNAYKSTSSASAFIQRQKRLHCLLVAIRYGHILDLAIRKEFIMAQGLFSMLKLEKRKWICNWGPSYRLQLRLWHFVNERIQRHMQPMQMSERMSHNFSTS